MKCGIITGFQYHSDDYLPSTIHDIVKMTRWMLSLKCVVHILTDIHNLESEFTDFEKLSIVIYRPLLKSQYITIIDNLVTQNMIIYFTGHSRHRKLKILDEYVSDSVYPDILNEHDTYINALIIMDCCFDGHHFKYFPIDINHNNYLISPHNICMITSSYHDSSKSIKTGSFFTGKFIEYFQAGVCTDAQMVEDTLIARTKQNVTISGTIRQFDFLLPFNIE